MSKRDDHAGRVRRKFAAAMRGLRLDSRLRQIGRECTTEAFFTEMLARQLGQPGLTRAPGEGDSAWLIRRLDQLKWISRHWINAQLERLSPEELQIAAMQICHTAADYCQDRAVERDYRARQMQHPAKRGTP
jgi:hypothetical protein